MAPPSSVSKLETYLHMLVCPVCHSALLLAGSGIDCTGCKRHYPIVDGLPVLIASRARLPE
jgi:uncharacterized protein YbaR (Trm112 family)